jgi:tripartite-type tricarboxylate transporter receptor subunit TctC
MKPTRAAVSTFFALSAVLLTTAAPGQEYPARPIHIIVGEAGGTADLIARIIGKEISGPLRQPVVVDNRQSTLNPELLAKAAPDGYTLHLTGGISWVDPLLRKTNYDPIRDFAPISYLANSPSALAVHPSLPVSTVQDLIALARRKPGELNYGAAGSGSAPQLAAELFKSMANVDIAHILYRGVGPTMNAIIGGEVQLTFSPVPTVVPHVKSGRLHMLAVTSAEPSTLAPGLPTLAASGLPGYEAVAILGIWAPAATPAPVINRLNQEIVRALSTPEMKDKFSELGFDIVASSPAQFGVAIKTDMSRWSKVIKDAGITAN